MPKFEQKYTEKDFIAALGSGFKTPGFVAKKVGCARSTALVYLNQLVEDEKAERIEVDEGQSTVFRYIEN
jgi:hypothetical protein